MEGTLDSRHSANESPLRRRARLRDVDRRLRRGDRQGRRPATLALTGLATSIDALAVGVGLAFVEVEIGWVAAAIGLTTFVMVAVGVMLGRVLGAIAGKRAEIVGGLLLIGIGTAILVEHLGATP